MKLITETFFDNKAQLVESSEPGKKEWVIEGIFAQAEKKNRNQRVYPKGVLHEQINKYVNEKVSTMRAIGELNHPDYPLPDPAKASHVITAIRENGNDYFGRAKILNTPQGMIVQGLLEGGVQLGVSTRGLGTVSEGVVNRDFTLNTIDIVSDPSGIDCWVNGIYEGAEWVWQNGILVESTVAGIKKQLDENYSEAKAIAAFNKFIKAL